MTRKELDDTEFENLLFRSEMIEKENSTRVKERMIGSAYTAWLGGAGGKQTFAQFCRNLGISKAETRSKVSREKKLALEANARRAADRILKMDRPKKQNEKTI